MIVAFSVTRPDFSPADNGVPWRSRRGCCVEIGVGTVRS